jgi:8-oxo-dGTP pyrophosphatase MutT (NUDIX family)
LREFREEIGIDIDDIDVEFEHVFGYEKYKVFSYRCSKNTLRNVVKNSSPQNGEIISVSTMKIKLFQDYVSKNEEERGWFSQPITALIDALRSDERTSYWQDKIWAKNNRNSDRERLGR